MAASKKGELEMKVGWRHWRGGMTEHWTSGFGIFEAFSSFLKAIVLLLLYRPGPEDQQIIILDYFYVLFVVFHQSQHRYSTFSLCPAKDQKPPSYVKA